MVRALGLTAAATTLAVSWGMARRGSVSAPEEAAFRLGNGAPDLVWFLVWPGMQSGNVAAPLVVSTLGWLRWRRSRPMADVLVAGYGAWAVAWAVKRLVERGRPGALLLDVHFREGASGFGYVSGHAAIASAMAAVLWPFLGWRARAASVTIAMAVGFGRVVAGAHLPLDVVGGAAIGLLVGGVVAGTWPGSRDPGQVQVGQLGP